MAYTTAHPQLQAHWARAQRCSICSQRVHVPFASFCLQNSMCRTDRGGCIWVRESTNIDADEGSRGLVIYIQRDSNMTHLVCKTMAAMRPQVLQSSITRCHEPKPYPAHACRSLFCQSKAHPSRAGSRSMCVCDMDTTVCASLAESETVSF